MSKNEKFVRVTTPNGTHYVRAKSKAAAINHVVKDTVTAEIMDVSEVYDAVNKGITFSEAIEAPAGEEVAEGPVNE